MSTEMAEELRENAGELKSGGWEGEQVAAVE